MQAQKGFACFCILLQLLLGGLLYLKALQQQLIDRAQVDRAEAQWIELEAEYQSRFQRATQYIWSYPSRPVYRYMSDSQTTYALSLLDQMPPLGNQHYATLSIEWKPTNLNLLNQSTYVKQRTVLLQCSSPCGEIAQCLIVS